MYTIEDLIKAGKDQVRKTPDLMSAYISLFEEKFGRKPDCAGCTFNNDWSRLIQNRTTINNNIEPMSGKTFKLRDASKIYTYAYQDKQTGRSLNKRRFGYLMEEDFAEEYLTNGTEEQIEIRKKEFKILPEKFRPAEPDLIVDTNDPEKLAELKKEAAEKGYPEEEYLEIDNDTDMASYIESKVLEQEAETKRLQEEAEERMRKQREDAEADKVRLAQEEADKKAKGTQNTETVTKEVAEDAKNKTKEKADTETAKNKK